MKIDLLVARDYNINEDAWTSAVSVASVDPKMPNKVRQAAKAFALTLPVKVLGLGQRRVRVEIE